MLNIGIKETWNDGYDYYCFHDVDKLPQLPYPLYEYSKNVVHLATAIEHHNFNIGYKKYLGGVLLMNREHIKKTNGFSNRYWGWGCEDDDMYVRIISEKIKIVRPNHFQKGKYFETNYRYQWIQKRKPIHKHQMFELNRNKILLKHSILKYSKYKIYKNDGLSNLNYSILYKNKSQDYSYFLIKTLI